MDRACRVPTNPLLYYCSWLYCCSWLSSSKQDVVVLVRRWCWASQGPRPAKRRLTGPPPPPHPGAEPSAARGGPGPHQPLGFRPAAPAAARLWQLPLGCGLRKRTSRTVSTDSLTQLLLDTPYNSTQQHSMHTADTATGPTMSPASCKLNRLQNSCRGMAHLFGGLWRRLGDIEDAPAGRLRRRPRRRPRGGRLCRHFCRRLCRLPRRCFGRLRGGRLCRG